MTPLGVPHRGDASNDMAVLRRTTTVFLDGYRLSGDELRKASGLSGARSSGAETRCVRKPATLTDINAAVRRPRPRDRVTAEHKSSGVRLILPAADV